ncbi:hypothetical protein [Shimia sp.]|uniref:hypothetical protein n=1 Tax=Shimia sp. TaxID=1954381 RepID=UPI0032992F08
MRTLLPALIAVLIMAVLIVLDVAKPLGAHPWWSQQTLMIGTVIGAIVATLATRMSTPMKRLMAFALITVLAFGLAKYGQTQFAASYAEDALAGKMWYYGWIETGAALAAAITAAAQVFLRK